MITISASDLKAAGSAQRRIASEISDLERQAREIDTEANTAAASVKAMRANAQALRDKVRARRALERLIAAETRDIAKSASVVVSEHALCRYVERVIGIAPDELRGKVVPADVEAVIRQMGDGTYPVGDTHRVKVRGGVVVTVLTNEGDIP